MTELVQYVTFGVAKDIFAAPVALVSEILDLAPISRLPKAPAELLGMIDVRGLGIPVVDLRALLSLPQADDTPSTRIVVLTVRRGGKDTVVGMKTDRVYEVTTLDEDALEPPPELGTGWNDGAVAGIGRRSGAFVTVLDLDRLVGGIDLKATSPSAAALDA